MPCRPFFRAFDGWWYAQVSVAGKRKQVKLVKGKDHEREAYRAFCRLVADDGPVNPAAANQSVATVCDLFLDASKRLHKPDTFEWHRYYLQDFCDRHGRLMTADRRPAPRQAGSAPDPDRQAPGRPARAPESRPRPPPGRRSRALNPSRCLRCSSLADYLPSAFA